MDDEKMFDALNALFEAVPVKIEVKKAAGVADIVCETDVPNVFAMFCLFSAMIDKTCATMEDLEIDRNDLKPLLKSLIDGLEDG